MKRLQTLSCFCLRALLWLFALFGLLAGLYLAFFGGAGHVLEGRLISQADLRDVYPIDRIEVYLLTHGTNTTAQGMFPMKVAGRIPHYGVAELEGDAANDFAEQWRYLAKSTQVAGMCHYPAYGLRMFSEGSLAFEGSFCWMCFNVIMEAAPGIPGKIGFPAQSEAGKALLAELDALLPYPRPDKAPADADTTEPSPGTVRP